MANTNHPPTQALIALGSNLPGVGGATPEANIRRAAGGLAGHGIRVLSLSPLYRTAPVPPSGQPDFVNAVALAETSLAPAAVLTALLEVERALGRVRAVKNEARIIDLDLLALGDTVLTGREDGMGGLVLPHPRLHERRFVLEPLCDVAPGWRHPTLGKTARDLLAGLPGPA